MVDTHDGDGPSIEGLFTVLENALLRLRALAELEAGELSHEQRERLARLLDELDVEAKRILEAFGTRCTWCRTAPADMVGQCAKCGGDACADCATAYDGVILHRGTCAAFYDGTPDS